MIKYRKRGRRPQGIDLDQNRRKKEMDKEFSLAKEGWALKYRCRSLIQQVKVEENGQISKRAN